MSTQLNPIIIFNYPDCISEASVYTKKHAGMIDILLLPLTPASRKRMIEAIASDIFYCDKAATLYEKAEAALAALENMALENSK